MSKVDQFKQEIESAYQFDGDSIDMGAAMLEGEVLTNTVVRLPLKTFNRHGLIAGATGTGKTKTLVWLCRVQVIRRLMSVMKK